MTTRYIYSSDDENVNAPQGSDLPTFEEREIELHGTNGDKMNPREAMKCLPKRGWLSRISLRVFGMY